MNFIGMAVIVAERIPNGGGVNVKEKWQSGTWPMRKTVAILFKIPTKHGWLRGQLVRGARVLIRRHVRLQARILAADTGLGDQALADLSAS